MKILITGGAGFIGSHMVKWLLQHGEEVLVLDNLEKGRRAAVVDSKLVEGHLRRRDDLEQVFRRHPIECVMHFAAYASVGDSVQNPAAYYENNVAGCCTLLEAMRAHKIDKFIFSSSAAVYGEPVSVLAKSIEYPVLKFRDRVFPSRGPAIESRQSSG